MQTLGQRDVGLKTAEINIVLQHDVHLVGAAWLDGERLLASAKASHHRRDSLIGGAVDKHLLALAVASTASGEPDLCIISRREVGRSTNFERTQRTLRSLYRREVLGKEGNAPLRIRLLDHRSNEAFTVYALLVDFEATRYNLDLRGSEVHIKLHGIDHLVIDEVHSDLFRLARLDGNRTTVVEHKSVASKDRERPAYGQNHHQGHSFETCCNLKHNYLRLEDVCCRCCYQK